MQGYACSGGVSCMLSNFLGGMCRMKEDLKVREPTKNEHWLHGGDQTGDATPVVGDKDSCAPNSALLDLFVL